MPTYQFKCPECYRLEDKYFTFTDKHLLVCSNSNCKDIPMDKVFLATPAIFTGTGWGKM
jgi:predicted nucleic acid-binding Zn ribbon protein